jgi:5-methylcytosine-specific restriction endonuclease McrA
MAKSQNWRKTREYRRWRVLVIRRDKVCDVCGSRQRRHAHHLNSGAYHPKERFDVDNGVTLCSKCHSNYHNNFNRSYRVKTTLYNYNNFKSLVKYLRGVL